MSVREGCAKETLRTPGKNLKSLSPWLELSSAEANPWSQGFVVIQKRGRRRSEKNFLR